VILVSRWGGVVSWVVFPAHPRVLAFFLTGWWVSSRWAGARGSATGFNRCRPRHGRALAEWHRPASTSSRALHHRQGFGASSPALAAGSPWDRYGPTFLLLGVFGLAPRSPALWFFRIRSAVKK